MLNSYKGLFSLLFLFTFLKMEAQVDENDSLRFYRSNNLNQLQFNRIDYSDLTGLQQYRPFGRNRLPIARAGNLGLVLHSYDIQLQEWDITNLLGGYQPYIYTEDSINFYKVSRPLTELSYMNGAESEQLFTVFHTQNLGEGLNISFKFNRINSEGFFRREQTNHTRFIGNYLAESRNMRFQSRGYIAISDVEAEENAGIFVSPLNNETSNTALLEINLNSAQNRGRSRTLSFNNQYHLIPTDSSSSLLKVEHQITFDKVYRNFDNLTNSNNPYYTIYAFDNSLTEDTSSIYRLKNRLGATLFDRLYAGIEQEERSYFQNYLINTDYSATNLLLNYKDTLFNLPIQFLVEKGLSGYFSDNTFAAFSLSLSEWKSWSTTLNLSYREAVPDPFLLAQRTNHQYFNVTLDNPIGNEISFIAKHQESNLSVKLSWLIQSDFIYYQSNADSSRVIVPNQLNETFQVASIQLSKNFTLLKHFNLNNQLVFRNIGNAEVLPLAEFYSFHSLFYENIFFKQALRFQTGFDLYLIGESDGLNYDPSLAQFYIDDGFRGLGPINQLDFFINLGITPNADVFIKMENILSDGYEKDSERIHLQPIPGRALKFGVIWRMIN